MKNKYIYIIAALFSFSSCSQDFLTCEPQGSLNEATLTSPDGIELLCTAAYGSLHSPNASSWFMTFSGGGCNDWLYGDVRSDIAYKGGGGIADCSDFHAMEVFNGVYPTQSHIDGKWYNLYCSIQRANSAIRQLNKITNADWSQRNSRLGEMKFLRSYFFFELQRLFNRIPYFDENVPTADYVKISNVQYTRDEILGKISQDLKEAADLLPENQTDAGRVTKCAALALQAKVELYRAYKQDDNYTVTSIDKDNLTDVVKLCDEIIGKGKYQLLPDWQDLDLVKYENGPENIFSIQFSIHDGTVLNRTAWFFALCSPGGGGYGGCGFFQPSQNLVNSYKTDANGLPLLDTYNNGNIQTIEDGYSNNVDPRLDFVVGRPGVRWKTYAAEAYNDKWVRDLGTYGCFSSKRHLISSEQPDFWNLGMSDLNWNLIRYADVLLWKAEALIELNRQDEALDLINQVRARAKNSNYVLAWNNKSNVDYAANYNIGLYQPGVNCTWNQDFARKALRFERKLEFAMEGERIFDLVRWGNASDVMNEYFSNEKKIRTYMLDAKFTHGKDEYLPIPINQIQLSGGLYKQNPGYNK